LPYYFIINCQTSLGAKTGLAKTVNLLKGLSGERDGTVASQPDQRLAFTNDPNGSAEA
jgi:hypothetical protein